MSSHSSSTSHSLYRHLVLLLLFPSLILCISDATLQYRDMTSPLFPRSVPNPNDIVNFDDMPSCGREKCIPYQSESIGCPAGDLTRDCYCDSTKGLDCAAYGCSTAEYTLFAKWRALTCTGFGFSQMGAVPSCAQGCLLHGSIFSSCSMKSWDCMCSADLPSACLATCSDADSATARAWKAAQCARVQPNVKAEGVARTTTIAAKISTYTSAGTVVTSTVAPAVTTVVNTNSNTNGNTNTINLNTGDAQSLLSGSGIMRVVFGIVGVQLLTVIFRRFV